MLKHVYRSKSSLRRSRGISPAASISSISTEVSTTSSFSDGSPSSISSAGSQGSTTTSPLSWRRLSSCRTSSRLNLAENPNAVPLRVYAAELRPDIQYKTVGVTQSTTCEEVVAALLAKCKVRFKDPRLFQLAMEVNIRGPTGPDTRASMQLEDSATPLVLQECYPRGQARFQLQMKSGTVVKVFDGSNSTGWEYKSIMISDKTTTSELVDILFRYTIKCSEDTKYYTLHLEVDTWKRRLDWDESVITAQNAANQWGIPKLVVKLQENRLSSTFPRGTSLVRKEPFEEDKLSNGQIHSNDVSLDSSGVSSISTNASANSPESIRRRNFRRERWSRSKSLSLSENFTNSPIIYDPTRIQSVSSCSATLLRTQSSHSAARSQNRLSLAYYSFIASFAKLNTNLGENVEQK